MTGSVKVVTIMPHWLKEKADLEVKRKGTNLSSWLRTLAILELDKVERNEARSAIEQELKQNSKGDL